MQQGSTNCSAHGSAVSCSGLDGATVLTGTCPYGEPITMAPQSLGGPFDTHWRPNTQLLPAPTAAPAEESVVDLEQLVLDVRAAQSQIRALTGVVMSLVDAIKLKEGASTHSFSAPEAAAPVAESAAP